jgi:formate dehydrogenase subunit gamma
MTVSALERRQATTRALADHADAPGALLPVLHAIQDALGFVPPESVDDIAAGLNLSRADVHGVLSFYHDFHTRPRARHVLRLCRAEACQAMGGAALEANLRRRLDLDADDRDAARDLMLEPAYCFGACACAPAAMLNGTLHARLDDTRLDELLRALETAP